MATAESVKTKLQGLIFSANFITGKGDTDLASAVGSLIEGYGQGGGGSDATIVNVDSLPNSVDNSKIYCFKTEVVTEGIVVTGGEVSVNTDYELVLVDELPESYDSIYTVFVLKDSGIGYMYYYSWYTVGQAMALLNGLTLEDRGFVTDEELAKGGLADGIYIHKEFIYNYGIPNTDDEMRRDVYVNMGEGWDKVYPDYIRVLIDGGYYPDMDVEYTIPSGTRAIRAYAFYQARLVHIVIPNSVTEIGAGAFGNSAVSEIDIPTSVSRIGAEAFSYCYNLDTVNIPRGDVVIGYRAFYNSIIYTHADSWENNIFYIGHHLLDTNNKCKGDVIVRDGTKTIQELAFENTTGVTSVTFPASVQYLNYGALAVPNCSKFTFNSLTPPKLDNKAIFTYSGVSIYVPANSLNAYKTADVWKNMADNIFPIEA